MGVNPFLQGIIEALPEEARATFQEEYQKLEAEKAEEKRQLESLFVPQTEDINWEAESIRGEEGSSPTDEIHSPLGPQEVIPPETNTTSNEFKPIDGIYIPPPPTQQQMASTTPPIPEEPLKFEATKELENINSKLAGDPAYIAQQRVGMPMPSSPSEVDPNTLTEADMEAGRQLLRGEVPTANIQENYNTALLNYTQGV